MHESVAVVGGAFDYRVDANGFWWVHRMSPVMLADHVLDLVRQTLDGRKQAVLGGGIPVILRFSGNWTHPASGRLNTSR